MPREDMRYFPSVFFQLPVICCSEGSWSKPGFYVSCSPQWISLPRVSSHTPLKSIWTCRLLSDLPPISFNWCPLVLVLEGETNNSSQCSLSLLCMTSWIGPPNSSCPSPLAIPTYGTILYFWLLLFGHVWTTSSSTKSSWISSKGEKGSCKILKTGAKDGFTQCSVFIY